MFHRLNPLQFHFSFLVFSLAQLCRMESTELNRIYINFKWVFRPFYSYILLISMSNYRIHLNEMYCLQKHLLAVWGLHLQRLRLGNCIASQINVLLKSIGTVKHQSVNVNCIRAVRVSSHVSTWHGQPSTAFNPRSGRVRKSRVAWKAAFTNQWSELSCFSAVKPGPCA